MWCFNWTLVPNCLSHLGVYVYGNFAVIFSHLVIKHTFGIGTFFLPDQAWKAAGGVAVDWHPQPENAKAFIQSQQIPLVKFRWISREHIILHLGMLFSTVKAQLHKAAEALATVVTSKVCLWVENNRKDKRHIQQSTIIIYTDTDSQYNL